MAPVATNTESNVSTGGAKAQKAKYSSKEIMHMEHEYSAYVTDLVHGKPADQQTQLPPPSCVCRA
jgi:hypothetical protein